MILAWIFQFVKNFLENFFLRAAAVPLHLQYGDTTVLLVEKFKYLQNIHTFSGVNQYNRKVQI